MSWNHCTITGEPLEFPVISKLTGHIYEKRVIEKHIASLGTCPITGCPMSLSDVIDIQVTHVSSPRGISLTSIPQLLNTFQSEWDTLMTETLQLRQQLQIVREELSHALYQHDAACRVIARLIRERDEARRETTRCGDREGGRMREEKGKEISEKAIEMNAMRKERRKGGFQGYASVEEIRNFKKKFTGRRLNLGEKGGLTCMNVNVENERIMATGGLDGKSVLYDLEENINVNEFTSHSKKVNEVIMMAGGENDKHRVMTCGDDNKGFLHECAPGAGKVEIKYQISSHSAPVTSISLHPLGNLVVACSRDASWSYHDIISGRVLKKISEFPSPSAFTSIKFHPDGHILAAGCQSGEVKLWNLCEESLVASLQGAEQECDLLQFSENGYHVATGMKGRGVVKIWDLRHLTNVMEFFKAEDEENGNSICFDMTGQVFSIGGRDNISLYLSKNWEKVLRFDGYQAPITGIQFGQFSRNLFTCALDGQITVYN